MACISLKRKRLFYSQDDDLILLCEVAGNNPYEDGGRWNIIEKNVQEATGKPFKKRSLQDRVSHLTEKYQKKMEEDQFKSGIEEDNTEIDDLLISIILLIKDFKIKTPKATPYKIGYERREAAANLVSTNLFEDYQEKPNIVFEVTEDIEYLQDYDMNDNNKERGHDLNNQNKEKEHDIINKNKEKEEIFTGGKGRGRGRGRGGGIGTEVRELGCDTSCHSKPGCTLCKKQWCNLSTRIKPFTWILLPFALIHLVMD